MTAALDTEQIRAALRKVVDPEVGANIVDLGLIYRIEFDGPAKLLIEMTMTSPACPMGEMIVDDAYAELDRVLPADCQPEIRLVWEPPWAPSMMSEKCRLSLGWNEADSE
ncbi:metal-sulfur cluster assembly factor [Ferribacterium limneticum]|uniref:metal-sulfur cluster assembly factor n=1 Tax=Ferribacterium limneticum TaxID=76259 RepID=UPI001CFB92CD|nr:metal-sulfur cluster assembly factor [Ferribacterium limneticum]UCV28268.1 metal-sulfur cluster assembly factor [Ferribacterium limneticum]UCV32185.1 metal-sulfur cluster assembly factor [Ferribacterium limneticum]